MKLTIVPFQGVVKGNGVLVLGSIIPFSLLYIFYLKNKRRHLPPSPTISLEPAPISSLARRLSKPEDLPFNLGLDKARDNPYNQDVNPSGVMQLGAADNLLCLDLLEQWLSENWNRSIGKDGINGIVPYQSFDGLMDLKLAMAAFMSKVMGGVTFDPSRLVLTCGATPAVEILMFCLVDPGDAFLIPTPYYSGDLVRTGVKLIPVHCRSSDNFALSIAAVDQAYNKARLQGLKVRGILLTNPYNPVGNILRRATLHSLLDFAREKNIHIVSDEIYAGSVYGNDEFVSMAELVKGNVLDKNRVHIIYGISKDLSLAGFRVGSIYSCNENVLTAAKELARFSAISSPTQRLLISMLSDDRFIKEYMETSIKRLKMMHGLFVAGLEELKIPCAKSDAGFFCWADMSGLIKPYSKKGEMDLWDKLLTDGNLFIIPGTDFHCVEPGWFRFCFSTLSEKDIPVVMARIQKIRDSCSSPANVMKFVDVC